MGPTLSCVGSLSLRLFGWREPTRGDIERLVVSRGTDGSNPVPSTAESATNRSSGFRLVKTPNPHGPRFCCRYQAARFGAFAPHRRLILRFHDVIGLAAG